MDIPKAVAPVTILPHFLNLPSSVSFLKNCQFGWKLGPSKTAEPTRRRRKRWGHNSDIDTVMNSQYADKVPSS